MSLPVLLGALLAALLLGVTLGFLLGTLRSGNQRAVFDELASRSLRANSDMFLKLARESFGREQVIAQASAQAALRERGHAIEQLVQPIRAALEKTEQQVAAIERERRDSFATLRTQIEGLAGDQATLQRETAIS